MMCNTKQLVMNLVIVIFYNTSDEKSKYLMRSTLLYKYPPFDVEFQGIDGLTIGSIITGKTNSSGHDRRYKLLTIL